MSEADPGDVFLRHRGAIIDALLADPYFGGSEAGASAEPEPASGGSAVSAPDSAGPPPSGDNSLFVGPEADAPPSEPETGFRDAGSAFPDADSAPARPPRRSSAGPSASERINALLSGQPATPVPDRSTDFAQEAADRINREAQDQQESTEQSAAQPAPATPQRSSPQQVVYEIGDQLRKPKVALAVAAVVALLIVVLLVFTGGEDTRETTPLAVAPPTSAAPPPVDVGEGSVTLQPEEVEANCPPGSTEGMDAFSGEPEKAWSCVRAYKVDGQVLTVDLGGEFKVDSIGIVPGWDHVDSDGSDLWSEFRTVSRVSYQFNNKDKTTYTQDTLDQRSLVVTKVDPPVTASEIVFTVLKSGGESAANAVAISSIVITGQE